MKPSVLPNVFKNLQSSTDEDCLVNDERYNVYEGDGDRKHNNHTKNVIRNNVLNVDSTISMHKRSKQLDPYQINSRKKQSNVNLSSVQNKISVHWHLFQFFFH